MTGLKSQGIMIMITVYNIPNAHLNKPISLNMTSLLKELNNTQKAWLAGFIDGEGYIGILKQRKKPDRKQSDSLQYHPYLIITSTKRQIIDYIKRIIGKGRIASNSLKSQNKAYFQYKLSQSEALEAILRQLQPYFKIKSCQSDLVRRFIQIRQNKSKKTGRGTRGLSSFGFEEEKIYQELRRLNKRGL